jgi:hypothetical protein
MKQSSGTGLAGFCLLAGIALTAGLPVHAHHSFGATYDVKERITLEGKLVNFMFRNPHSFVHVEVPDADGVVERWSVEWSGAAALTRQGVERGTLRVGDEVAITAHPSRTPGELRAQMLTLRRPVDGLTWGDRADEVVD